MPEEQFVSCGLLGIFCVYEAVVGISNASDFMGLWATFVGPAFAYFLSIQLNEIFVQ